MYASDLLNQYRNICRTIKKKEDEILLYKVDMCSIGSPVMNSTKVQTSGTSDKIGNSIVILDEKERELEDLKHRREQIKKKEKEFISVLSDEDLKKLLYKRYIQFKSFKSISREIGMSETWIIKLHKKAVAEIQNIIDSI